MCKAPYFHRSMMLVRMLLAAKPRRFCSMPGRACPIRCPGREASRRSGVALNALQYLTQRTLMDLGQARWSMMKGLRGVSSADNEAMVLVKARVGYRGLATKFYIALHTHTQSEA